MSTTPTAADPATSTAPPEVPTSAVQTQDDVAAKKQEAMNAAVEKFKAISTSLGGHEQAKAFFDTYGTDGFKPESAAGERELIKAKEMTLDSEIKDYSERRLGLPTRPEGFGATYAENPAWEIEEPEEVSVASALSSEEWQELMDSTKMLHGYVLNKTSGLSRARFQAFQLKPPPGKSYTDTAAIKPHYEVFDASSISIKETKSQAEKSMAQNGFSSEAISASVSVSTPFVGGSASASHSTESQDSKSSSDLSDRQEYTATYNFPRARIFLDDLNLEVTTECAKYLVNIQNAANKIKENIDNGAQADQDGAVKTANRLVNQFYSRFGHIFACTIQLGGQLTSTKSASSFASTKDEEKRDAMQAAVAVSVESKFVSASASYSRGQSNDNKSHESNVNSSSALAWAARGGNTLLCTNPAAWANSVAGYKQWRVMEQENVVALPDLISRLVRPTDDETVAWPGISETFIKIAQEQFNEISAVPPGTWTGKLMLETNDGRKVIIKDGQLCLSDAQQDEGTVLYVLDADMKRRSEAVPRMVQLYADHPLFLMSSKSHARQSQTKGAQFTGLWVDSSDSGGKIKSDGGEVCRWSLRPAEVIPAANTVVPSSWAPDRVVIRDGDEVGLYCHSYYSGGPYTTTDKPPLMAPSVVRRPDEAALRVWRVDSSWLPATGLVNDTMKNDPNWAFAREDRATIQALSERSDLGQTSEAEEAQLDTYRRIFRLADKNNYDAEFDILLQHPNYVSTMNTTIGPFAGWSREDWYKFLRPQVFSACPTSWDKRLGEWANSNGFMATKKVVEGLFAGSTMAEPKVETLRLRVKFVT